MKEYDLHRLFLEVFAKLHMKTIYNILDSNSPRRSSQNLNIIIKQIINIENGLDPLQKHEGMTE